QHPAARARADGPGDRSGHSGERCHRLRRPNGAAPGPTRDRPPVAAPIARLYHRRGGFPDGVRPAVARARRTGVAAPGHSHCLDGRAGLFTRAPPKQGKAAVIAPPILRAVHVTVRVGERALLDDMTLVLPPGSMTVLLGPNGAGKTTLIRVLAGI